MSTPSKIYREEHELFRKTVSAFIEREIAPHYERWEKEGQGPGEVMGCCPNGWGCASTHCIRPPRRRDL